MKLDFRVDHCIIINQQECKKNRCNSKSSSLSVDKQAITFCSPAILTDTLSEILSAGIKIMEHGIKAMDTLMAALGSVDTERFIAMINATLSTISSGGKDCGAIRVLWKFTR